MRRRKAPSALALFGGVLSSVFLNGCSASGLQATGTVASVASIAGGSWIDAKACGRDLLYVNAAHAIQIFDLKPRVARLCGSLGFASGISQPAGIFVDAQQNLWVTDFTGARVLEFAKGATTASLTLDDAGAYPTAVALDRDGTVYVANAVVGSGQPNVEIYPKGATEPSRELAPPGKPVSLSVDRAGDLYVAYTTETGAGDVERFVHAAGVAHDLGVDPMDEPIALDRHGNLIACDPSQNGCGFYADGSTRYTLSFAVQNGASPMYFALDKTGTRAWVAGATDVTEWTYPGTRSETPLATIEVSSGSPAWMATSPSARVGDGYRL